MDCAVEARGVRQLYTLFQIVKGITTSQNTLSLFCAVAFVGAGAVFFFFDQRILARIIPFVFYAFRLFELFVESIFNTIDTKEELITAATNMTENRNRK